jgi:hypothetical protein
MPQVVSKYAMAQRESMVPPIGEAVRHNQWGDAYSLHKLQKRIQGYVHKTCCSDGQRVGAGTSPTQKEDRMSPHLHWINCVTSAGELGRRVCACLHLVQDPYKRWRCATATASTSVQVSFMLSLFLSHLWSFPTMFRATVSQCLTSVV